ncbi:MAG: hypothetical protein QOF58_1184 [Pseudonocardiales bacterium]|nr:hypothetical protein [Actinomycetota bacterium]MDT7782765.1 hypothetical protein [Pseudonocardiales bacterium]
MGERRHITKQHVVSQVVLAAFAVDGQVEVEDVRRPGRWRLKAPAAVGYVNDYVQHDSAGAEALWQTVETRLRDALDELRFGRLPPRGSEVEATIRDCIAVHWARSKAVSAMSERLWERVRHDHMRAMAGHPDVLAAVFQIRTGRTAEPAELQETNEWLHAGPPEIRSGEHFSGRVRYLFEQAQAKFGDRSLQVGMCGNGVENLLMSDCPVVTPSRSRAGLNPEQGVALGDADAAGMPLGPRVFVSLHDRPERVVIGFREARMLNDWQRTVRREQLFRQPVNAP